MCPTGENGQFSAYVVPISLVVHSTDIVLQVQICMQNSSPLTAGRTQCTELKSTCKAVVSDQLLKLKAFFIPRKYPFRPLSQVISDVKLLCRISGKSGQAQQLYWHFLIWCIVSCLQCLCLLLKLREL